MTFKKVLILGMLAVAGASASAAGGDWGDLASYGPNGAEGRGITTAGGSIDDFYTFTLGSGLDVLSIISYYTAGKLDGSNAIDLNPATLTLWKGTYNDGVADTKVAWENFGPGDTNHTFGNLTAGSYYFEVSGTAGSEGSDYYLNVAANAATPPSNVPEPANMALLLSGIGLLGIVAKRRKNG